MVESSRHSRLDSLRRWSLIVGGLATAACLLRAGSDQFFQSFLLAFLFWLALPLGSLAILMLHHMVGGKWGFVVRRFLEAATRTFPLMAIAFVPVAIGMSHLYPWADAATVTSDPHLEHKTMYLNRGFFLTRAAFYFAVWITLALFLSRWSARQDETGSRQFMRRLQMLSGGGLVLFGLTTTFASIDWAMSLEPLWFSTIYGGIFMVGYSLTALAAAVLFLALFRGEEPLAGIVKAAHFHDLGKLLLAFVMLWAYVALSQFLIIWSGNTLEEIPWYLSRQRGGWELVASILIGFHFVVPFLLLLSRQRKKDPRSMVRIVSMLLVMRFVDLVWIVCPAFRPEDFGFSWMDIAATVGVGGLWLASFLTELRKRPLLPLNDPRFESLPAGAVHHG